MPLRPVFVALALAAACADVGAPEGAVPSVPRDRFGRPLVDEHGPMHYRFTGDGWLARTGAGGFVPADGPRLAESPPGRPVPAGSGFTLASYSNALVGSWPESVAIGDVTGDGRPDVVMTTTFYFDDENDYHVFVFAQDGGGELLSPVGYPYLATGNRSGLVLTDLDEDGVLDVVVGHGTGITVLVADGAGGLAPGVVHTDADADTLAAMDVDRDSHQDVVSLGWSRGASVFYGDGSGGFSSIAPLGTNVGGYNDHEVEDLTGDGVTDLAVMSGQLYAVPNLSVHRGLAAGGFAPLIATTFVGMSELTGGVGLGDVSGDGRNDAVLSRPSNSPTWMWLLLQDGEGALAAPEMVPSYDIPESVEVTDLDGDAREDVVVVHAGWLALGVYLQREDGSLGDEERYDLPYASHYAPQGLAVGDVTSDTCADVAIADYNNGLVLLEGRDCASDPDGDGDGLADADDNCPLVANSDQADGDGDGVGDRCDVCPDLADPAQFDDDDDGVGDACDDCPNHADPGQEDGDGDGLGDACDACDGGLGGDRDEDGVNDACDVCPDRTDPEQGDRDDDGEGDACDLCGDDPMPTGDADGDGLGDACDSCPDDAGLADNDGCPPEDTPDGDGCECRARGRGSVDGVWFVLGAAMICAARRRRRAR